MILFIVGGIFVLAAVIAFAKLLEYSKKQGELQEDLEDVEAINAIQQKYNEIASRPAATADVILIRMRKEGNNK